MRILFWFFLLPTAKTPAPIFTINKSNDVVTRKNVLFGVPKTIFYISILFPQKSNRVREAKAGSRIVMTFRQGVGFVITDANVTIGSEVSEGTGVEFRNFASTCVVLKTLWLYRASV